MRRLKSPRLVLFDLDDTLCDQVTSFRERVRRAVYAALAGDRLPSADALIERIVESTLMCTDDLVRALDEHGLGDPWRIERAIRAYTSDRYVALRLFDGAVDVVRQVQRYAATGLVTNGPSWIQREKLRYLGIEDLFPLVIVSEEVGVAKPDPAIFRLAFDRAGVPASDAAFVGDNPFADIAGAQAAGLASIWYNPSGRPWPGGSPPDAEIRELSQLVPLLFAGAPRGA